MSGKPQIFTPSAAVSRLAVALFLVTTLAMAEEPAPRVEAGGEMLSGAWVGEGEPVAAFLGVPFAAPPVGEQRWRAPVPHVPRPGVQDATHFAPACMQGSGGVDWYLEVAKAFGHGPGVIGRPVALSEDCLYLNVWTPRPGDAAGRLPVMVFVHGGGNSGGWSYEPNYLGHSLAARGAVVVTVAYRLGPFGFFAHPALDNGTGQPVANFGLLDLRAAFEWVRDNAAAFGGDPSRVTAFGESAGAFNLVDLLLADLDSGHDTSLFRRLISQSIGGSLVERQTLAEERDLWEAALAGVLRNGPGSVPGAGDLRALTSEALLDAAATLPEDYYPDAVIDGLVLRRRPLDVIRERSATGVELVAGTNADEWLMYVPETAGEDELREWIASYGGDHAGELRAAVAGQRDARRALDRLRTARQMLCPSYLLAEWASRRGGAGWVYRFSRQRQGPGGDALGAYHGTELPYVFDTHDEWLPTTAVDRSLTEAVVGYWTGFARSGAPAAAEQPRWPPYGRREQTVMQLGDRVAAIPAPDRALCRFLGLDAASLLGESS